MKRFLRILPAVFCIVVLLFSCLLLIFKTLTTLESESETSAKFQIAMVGSADDSFLQMGISALSNMDSSRFAIDILQMPLDEAKDALERGRIAAYVVIPDEFVEKALHGEIIPLEYVGRSGAAGVISLVKDEITYVITDILVGAQKGIYGTWDLMWDHQLSDRVSSVVDRISIEFVKLVISRNKTYRVTELGISDTLGLEGHMLCGLSVLLLLLATLPFAGTLIKHDYSINRILSSRGRPVPLQMLCEFLAYFLTLVALLFLLIISGGALGAALEVDLTYLVGASFATFVLRLITIVFVVGTLSFFLFEISDNLVSGVLLTFFMAIALSYIGGCMYPAYFFPEPIQILSGWLPTGLARMQMASCITGQGQATMGLLLYGGIFLVLSYGVRWVRTTQVRG